MISRLFSQKKYMKKLPIACFCFFLIFLSSCTKEGPQGPAGVGNLKSKTIAINPSDWQWNSSQLAHYVDVPFDAINSSLISNGAVLGYLDGSFDGVNGWFSLPFTKYPFVGSGVYLTYEVSVISIGNCRIRLIWSDGRQSAPTTSRTFRILALAN